MDLETELYQLERRMLLLVKSRDEVILEANHAIREANREFDEIAVPLGKQINDLRERLKRDATPADKKRAKPMLDLSAELDEEDQAHYRELLARRKKR